jgi:hypothetical protein
MLWIRDILVRFRMRIREAPKHTDPTDPDADPEHVKSHKEVTQ